MLRDIYLESGLLSFAAWFGTAITLAAVVGIVVGALGMRVRHTLPAVPRQRRQRGQRRQWRPLRRMALVAEMAVRVCFGLAARVLRLNRSSVQSGGN